MPRAALKILLVEDNPADVRLVRELLLEARLAVVEEEPVPAVDLFPAENLAEGLARLESVRPDVVLLDLTLPDSTGYDTFAAVHQHPARPPVILLTGLGDEELAMRCMRNGAQDYLAKGTIDGNLLVRAVRYAIERHRLVQELRRALANVKTLSGLLPICSGCKKIRDDKGYWNRVESYIQRHSEALVQPQFLP